MKPSLSAWIIFSINKRLKSVEFPVLRSIDHNLNVDAVCRVLYPELKTFVDNKWLSHICERCHTRFVVMDGAAKVYRGVCKAKGEKITNTGQLNIFTACANSPLPSNLFCDSHMNDKSGDTIERLDTGMMTRARRISLGLELEELTSKEGCRKEEAITVRSTRSKTAGMLYCYRPCGISLGHLEADIDNLLFTTFLQKFQFHCHADKIT